jgi:hypothetical protein
VSAGTVVPLVAWADGDPVLASDGSLTAGSGMVVDVLAERGAGDDSPKIKARIPPTNSRRAAPPR